MSSHRAPSRTKAVGTAATTASSMARVESNDGNGMVRYDPSYASSSSTLSATTTTLKREWSLAHVKDTKRSGLLGLASVHNHIPRAHSHQTPRPPSRRCQKRGAHSHQSLIPTTGRRTHSLRATKRFWGLYPKTPMMSSHPLRRWK